MCGIAILRASAKQLEQCRRLCSEEYKAELQSIVNRDLSTLFHRGPELCSCSALVPCGSIADDSGLLAIGCVLSQRGGGMTAQPLSKVSPLTNKTFCLLWNGEIFHVMDKQLDRRFQSPIENDAEVLLSLIQDASTPDEILQLFSSIRGPFAFILTEFPTNKIYFGRDRFGRRSLVARCQSTSSDDTSMVLDCVSNIVLSRGSEQKNAADCDEQNWIELPASGVYTAQLMHTKDGCSLTDICMYPWTKEHLDAWPSFQLNTIRQLGFILSDEDPVLSSPSVPTFESACAEFLKLLRLSVQDRVQLASSTCATCTIESSSLRSAECRHSRFAILFSGGLDSTVIAALCDQFVPSGQPIDLINVAFEQSPVILSNHKATTRQLVATSDAPDRLTALQSFRELCDLSPSRKWQLILVDVSLEELRAVRSSYIKRLLLPGRLTVLDESLGLATWFAARGVGKLVTRSELLSEPGLNTLITNPRSPYCSPAKVVFVGTGVDEQLAGYSRHRNIFEKYGPEALEKELVMEMRRISERNLGRDDRIISDHGREARFPYLDERVTHFLRHLPIHWKADLTQPRGIGEKRLLRQVAHNLGLTLAATLPKRAMQFGSRIAKAEGSSRLTGSADKVPAHLDA